MTILAGKRIGLLTAWASRLGGGVFQAVSAQAQMIRAAGGEVRIFALRDAWSDQDARHVGPSPLTSCPVIGPRQIGFSPRLLDALLGADLDCLHLHGIWMYPSRAAMRWARATGRPYVVSAHGMLDPLTLSRGRWKKALARLGYERANWRAATVLHALTERERANIARACGRSDCLVIPNAAPDPGPAPEVARLPRVLFLSRVHPAKRLSALLLAWTALERAGTLPEGAELVIAGWGDDVEIDALKAELASVRSSIRFIGPVFDEAKAREIGMARFLILPSLSEGMPMTVLESWAAGTPVLMSGECNLPEGFAAGAALDCGTTPETIAACLERALRIPESAWLDMAHAAQALVFARFTRERLTEPWAQVYARLIAGERNL